MNAKLDILITYEFGHYFFGHKNLCEKNELHTYFQHVTEKNTMF